MLVDMRPPVTAREFNIIMRSRSGFGPANDSADTPDSTIVSDRLADTPDTPDSTIVSDRLADTPDTPDSTIVSDPPG